MKKSLFLFLSLISFACSSAENVDSTQEALCGAGPTPAGLVSNPMFKGDSSASGAVNGRMGGGNTGTVYLGTNAGFTCTGSWDHSGEVITSVTYGPISGGLGCKLHIVGPSHTSDVSCASSDGQCSSGSWTGDYLRLFKGTTVSGVAQWQLGGPTGAVNNTSVIVFTNACQ